MANSDKPRLRFDKNAGHDRDDRSFDALDVPIRDAKEDFGERPDFAQREIEDRVPPEPIETDEERAARERREFIAVTDDTEIVDGGYSTTAYRRAIAVFEDDDAELQLAEHYYFRSAAFERHGRF